MKKVSIENIEPDMVLARDVSATSGNVLLGKGTVLTPSMGRRLKNWSIFFVYIEGEEESEHEEAAVEVSPEEVKKMLEDKFHGQLGNPLMQRIFNAVFDFKVNKKSA